MITILPGSINQKNENEVGAMAVSTFCGRLGKKFQNIHHLEALFDTFRTPDVGKSYLLVMILKI